MVCVEIIRFCDSQVTCVLVLHCIIIYFKYDFICIFFLFLHFRRSLEPTIVV